MENFNLYDFNKVNMAQIKPYDPIALNNMISKVTNKLWENVPAYWMLLCRERNDYTLFHLYDNKEELSSALSDCFNNRGKVIDITEREDGAFEVWIRNSDTDENFLYYLFNYNEGIIEV